MARSKSNSRNLAAVKQVEALSGKAAIEAAIDELIVVENILYVAKKAFCTPDFDPRDDTHLNAYSVLSVSQDRLASVLHRLKPQASDHMAWAQHIAGNEELGLVAELAKLIGIFDLTTECTGSLGSVDAPAVVHIAHAETRRMLEFAEKLAKHLAESTTRKEAA